MNQQVWVDVEAGTITVPIKDYAALGEAAKPKPTYLGTPWPHVFCQSSRGCGKTLRQMVAAPKGAYFIWCNDQAVLYAKNLARYLGRDDLIIVGFSYLQDKNFRGRGPMTIVVDHAADISKVDSFAIYWLLENSTARVSP